MKLNNILFILIIYRDNISWQVWIFIIFPFCTSRIREFVVSSIYNYLCWRWNAIHVYLSGMYGVKLYGCNYTILIDQEFKKCDYLSGMYGWSCTGTIGRVCTCLLNRHVRVFNLHLCTDVILVFIWSFLQ